MTSTDAFDIYHRGGTERIAVSTGQPLPPGEQGRWTAKAAQTTLPDDLAKEVADKGFSIFDMRVSVEQKPGS